jgi:hypothetical protein
VTVSDLTGPGPPAPPAPGRAALRRRQPPPRRRDHRITIREYQKAIYYQKNRFDDDHQVAGPWTKIGRSGPAGPGPPDHHGGASRQPDHHGGASRQLAPPIISTSPEPMVTARLGQMVTLSPRRLGVTVAEQPLRSEAAHHQHAAYCDLFQKFKTQLSDSPFHAGALAKEVSVAGFSTDQRGPALARAAAGRWSRSPGLIPGANDQR